MANKIVFDYSFPDARLREAKYRFHRMQAKFWLFPLIVTNTLFYFFVLAMIGVVLREVCVLALLLPIIICWRMLKKIRSIRSRHLILAEGYAKPFAEEIITKARSAGHQFALFLRGFNLEAQNMKPSGINVEFGFREPRLYARPVEALLVEMLSENLPLIALTDPSDPHPIGGAYRFQSVPTDWKQFVSELLPDAFLVIMHLNTSYSLGVLDELEILKHSGYSKKAVIVVGKNVAVENNDDGKWFKRALTKFDYIVFQQTDSMWSRKHEINFHHRLRECLQRLEHNSQEKQEIVRKDRERFTVVTPSWLGKLLSFIRGPALGSLGCLIAIGILDPYDSFFVAPNTQDFLDHIGRLLFIWLLFVFWASILKGLFFILRIIS